MKFPMLTYIFYKFKQTINFGVYACDLAYCVTNDKYEEASKYLKVAKKCLLKLV